MLEQLTIKNYKSINDLTLNLGRINVFIGENGCGKSNILEAIALAGASDAGKLDREFLSSRGIRATEPDNMVSLFFENNKKPIEIQIKEFNNDQVEKYTLAKDNNENYPNLTIVHDEETKSKIKQNIRDSIEESILKIFKDSKRNSGYKKAGEAILNKVIEDFYASGNYKLTRESNIIDFLIYSPENSALRKFYDEGQIEPLGVNGEGLLKLVKLFSDKYPEEIEVIKESLELFDWYESFEIPEKFNQQNNKITLTDRYIDCIKIDQRSANEGFLFILFYISLVVSKDTPSIFAVDNIDASLNPKLCTRLIKDLVRLSEKYEKQMFLTTHNPAILDGLNLHDPMQKLFVISRNRLGYTEANEITFENKPKQNGEPVRLSEAMLRGYIGGLPEGF